MYSRQIEVFVQVVEQKSFSKAAEELFISSTAIMKQINSLEDQVGVTLLNRSNKGISLTPAGKSFYEDAKEIIKLSNQAIQRAKNIMSGNTYAVRIGTSNLNSVKQLDSIWKKINNTYPQINLEVIPFEDNSLSNLEIIKYLGTYLDVIIGPCDSQEWTEYCNTYILSYYQLCCAVPTDHKLAHKKEINLEDLHGEHLMMVEEGNSHSNDQLRKYIEFNHPQIKIKDTSYYYDLEVFNQCEQMGYVLLTLDEWANVHPSLVTIPLNWHDNQVPYGLIYTKKTNESINKFIESIIEVTK